MKVLKAVAGVISFIAALGLAGTSDMTEHIIQTMPEESYRFIRDSLSVSGETPSDYDIAMFYFKQKDR